MNFYLIVLFLHILGATGIFLGLGMEGIIFKSLKHASNAEQVLNWGSSFKLLRINFAVSTLLLLLPGIYLVMNTWSWTPWIILGLIILTALSGLGSMTGKKIAKIIKSLGNSSQPLSDEIRAKLSAPIHLKFYKIKILLVIGTLFLMTLKPDWLESIIVLIASLVIGLFLSMQSK